MTQKTKKILFFLIQVCSHLYKKRPLFKTSYRCCCRKGKACSFTLGKMLWTSTNTSLLMLSMYSIYDIEKVAKNFPNFFCSCVKHTRAPSSIQSSLHHSTLKPAKKLQNFMKHWFQPPCNHQYPMFNYCTIFHFQITGFFGPFFSARKARQMNLDSFMCSAGIYYSNR